MFKNRRPASRQAANASGKSSSSVSPAARRPRNSTVLAFSSTSESACIWGSRSLIVATIGRIERIRRSLELPKIRTRPSETFSDKAVNASVVLSQSSVSTSIAAIPHALSLLKARSYNRQWASVKRTGAAFRSLDQMILRSPWDGRSAFPRSEPVDHVALRPDANLRSGTPDKVTLPLRYSTVFRGRFPDAIPSWFLRFQFWRSAGLLGRPGKPPAAVGFQQVPGGGRAAAALEQGAHSLGVGGGAVGIGRGIRAWAAQTRGSSQTGQQAEKSQVEGNPAEGLDPRDQVDERGWTLRFSQ